MTSSTVDPFAGDFKPSLSAALYPIKMEGSLDAPEGLLSWVVGLAQAHCVGPRAMLKNLLAGSEQYDDIWRGSTFFERDCGTVNGLGAYARMMVELLGPVLPHEVNQMTMLGLSQFLPRNGEGLTAKSPRWCPHCLCDQARALQRPHFPLVWSFEYYRVCHIHHTVMQEHCPACGHTQSYIPCYPSLLHCGSCGESMLVPLPEGFHMEEPVASEFEKWCATALVDLVSRLDLLWTAGSLVHLRSNIDAIVDRFTMGNRKRLCEDIGLQIYALNGWVNKDERPSLSVLLRLCHGIGLMPACIFLPGAVDHVTRTRAVFSSLSSRECRPLLGYRQRERIQKQLEVISADTTDHRGLAAIADQVGLSRHALKYWFPKHSRSIVHKKRACESRRLELQYKEDHDFLRAVIQRMCAQGIYPSRRRVNAELGTRKISLIRPDIFRVYERLRQSPAFVVFSSHRSSETPPIRARQKAADACNTKFSSVTL
ncbi:TniQ family protein [Rhodoferax sp. TBRC 17660]|uniref:TniQ family protein n=1 Tax=Rhodoferax potami TaxID=3068338 RepID=A0ABU3KM82_9BURK|nr:TniQ family protein [Rhodoferax sp. TBRC 17660]MDT7518631.1 TniQ family protein [Rhodoferax sp. TBRC 17660]